MKSFLRDVHVPRLTTVIWVILGQTNGTLPSGTKRLLLKYVLKLHVIVENG